MAKQKKKNARGKRPYRPKQTSNRPKGARSSRRSPGKVARAGAAGGSAARGGSASAAGPQVQRFRWPGAPSAPAAAPASAARAPSRSIHDFAASVPRLSLEQLDALSDPAQVAALLAEAEARREAERPPPKRLVIQPVGPSQAERERAQVKADAEADARSRNRGQLAGLVFLLAGLAFAAWIVEDVARDAAAQHWQTTPGKVTVCKSERVSSDPPRYESHFAYRYKADGKWHTGRRVRFAGGQGEPVRTYKVGQDVKVYLDPEDAAVSTLKPGVIGWAWAQLIAGLVAAGLGGLYLVLGGRRGRSASGLS